MRALKADESPSFDQGLESQAETGVQSGWGSSLAAALLCAVLTIVYAVADATLLFAVPFPQRLSAGLGMALVGVWVTVMIMALGSRLKGLVAGAQEVIAIMLAALLMRVVSDFPAQGHEEQAFATAVAAIVLTTIATGAACLLAARYKLGQVIHYVPWSVVAGFLAGTGLTLSIATVPIILAAASLSDAVQHFNVWQDGAVLTAAVLLAAALMYASRLRHASLVLVMILAAGFVLWQWGLPLAGYQIDTLRAEGMTLAATPVALSYPPLSIDELSLIEWSVVIAQLPFILMIVLVTLCTVMIKIGATGLILDQDTNEDREIAAVGISHLFSGLLGGISGFHSVSLTQVVQRLNAARLMTVVMLLALILLTIPLIDSLLTYIPRFLIGGILLWIGFDLFSTWLFAARRLLSGPEFMLVLGIALSIAIGGFVTGFVLGLMAACVVFIIEYSRTDILRSMLSVDDSRSTVARTLAEQQVIDRVQAPMQVLRLQGHLFFGSSRRILRALRERLSQTEAVQSHNQFLVIDFEQVEGFDLSFVQELDRIIVFADERGLLLVLTALPVSRRRAVQHVLDTHDNKSTVVQICSTLDEGFEWCERQVLADRADATGSAHALSLDPLVECFDEAIVTQLQKHAERISLQAGEALIQQGLHSDAVYIVLSGTLSVRIGQHRLRRLGPGMLIGEVSYYLQRPATADVVADTPVRLWCLTDKRLKRLSTTDPLFASQFNQHVARVIAERLRDNSRQIRLLSG